MQDHIEQSAQTKRLGAFRQRYLESCSLARAWGYTLLFSLLIGAWGVAFLSFSLDQLLQAWPLFILSMLWFTLCGSVILSSWQSYMRPEWIYLYHDGFIYDEKERCQTYHWREVSAITPQYQLFVSGKNQATLRFYQVKLDTGKTLNLVKGNPLLSQFEYYRQSLSKAEQFEFDPQQGRSNQNDPVK